MPLFYRATPTASRRGGSPHKRSSMRSLVPVFNTNRMVRQYAEQVYVANGDAGPP